jgi:hypothetical protein
LAALPSSRGNQISHIRVTIAIMQMTNFKNSVEPFFIRNTSLGSR